MNNKYFIEKVHLGGYKSIQNTSVDFLPDLNIVIGKNGTGKTNFFEFLNKSMNLKFASTTKVHFEAQLKYEGKPLTYTYAAEEIKKNGSHRTEKVLNVKGEIVYDNKHYSVNKNIIQKENEDIDISELEGDIYIDTQGDINISSIKYIKYGYPMQIKEGLLGIREELKFNFFSETSSNFSQLLTPVIDIFSSFIYKHGKDIDKMREYVPELAKQLSEKLNFDSFIKYSPIQDVRVNKGIIINYQVNNEDVRVQGIDKIIVSKGSKLIFFSNIFYEYRYNNEWFTFDELSDGTKRVLYIIHEIIYNNIINENTIIFLEEPEIGIHPHQFHLLMDFLKEASETKQIIISTHSPQALNVLNMNELDRIIVADMTAEGTQFHHLSEKTKAKARKYMENEDSLGTFWLHSDLEQ